MSSKIDLEGKTFGKLTVLNQHMVSDRGSYKVTMWLCSCSCGSKEWAIVEKLQAGRKKQCFDCFKIARTRGFKPRSADGEASFNYLLARYKCSAKKKSLAFDLNRDQFRELTKGRCHYCSSSPKRSISGSGIKSGPYTYNGIDRMNNTIGYTSDNSVSCCTECNFLKKDIPYEEFRSLITRIYKNWGKK
jgi:hypothetical protein